MIKSTKNKFFIYLLALFALGSPFISAAKVSVFEQDTLLLCMARYDRTDSLLENAGASFYVGLYAQQTHPGFYKFLKIYLDENKNVLWENLRNPSLEVVAEILYNKTNDELIALYPEIKDGYLPMFKVLITNNNFTYQTTDSTHLTLLNASFKDSFLFPEWFIPSEMKELRTKYFKYSGDTSVLLKHSLVNCYRFRTFWFYHTDDFAFFYAYYGEVLFEKESLLPLSYLKRALETHYYPNFIEKNGKNSTETKFAVDFHTIQLKPDDLEYSIWGMKY